MATNVTAIVHIDESTKAIQTVGGRDIVRCSFWTNTPHDITIGDYIYWNNKQYFVNIMPDVKKAASNRYEYDVTFERRHYDLAKVQCRNA